MTTAQRCKIDAESWQEWKMACSIENCLRSETIQQLIAFGQNRLGKALRRYSPETARIYCDPDGKNKCGAWLKVEQYLYAGTSRNQERAGKAYKDRLLEGCANLAHLEAILTLKIQREITRWILAEECFDITQRKDPKTGHKAYVVTRVQTPTSEIDDLQARVDGIYCEPVREEDEDAVMQAVASQAKNVWQLLEGPQKKVQRLLLVCFLNGVLDLKLILKSGLINCKKSQLYNERKKILTLLETLDWGPNCPGEYQKAFMLRRMMPELGRLCSEWMLAVENQQTKLFIEVAGQTAGQ